jgi:hypothetical protein
MNSVALTGSDTIKLNDKILADLADGDAAVLSFPNEVATVKTGKNGNAIYGLNESGKQADMVMRVLRGSDDDKFLNNLFANQQNNFAGTVLMIGEFTKRVGDGTGKVAADTYITSGGVFSKGVEAKSNVEGDTEQSVAIYNIKFSKAVRVIT